MPTFHYVLKEDYDKRVNLGSTSLLCYSAKRLREIAPDAKIAALPQARIYTKRERTARDKDDTSLFQRETVAQMPIAKRTLGIAPAGTNGKIRYQQVGYVYTTEGGYIAIHRDRMLFWLILLWLLLLIALCVGLLLWWQDKEPTVLQPDHPLPPVDSNVNPEDDGDKADAPTDGSGEVSLVYTLVADVTLYTGAIDVYFKNPNESNQSMMLELYILSDEGEFLVATSGLIPTGHALQKMTLDENAPALSKGTYKGLYRVYYYHPETGVRAHVQTDIADVTVNVKP